MCSNKHVHFADDLSERLAFGNYNAEEAKRVYFNDNVPLRPFAESQLPAAVAPVRCTCKGLYRCALHRRRVDFKKMILRILALVVLVAVVVFAYNRLSQSRSESLPATLTATPASDVGRPGVSLDEFIRRLQ